MAVDVVEAASPTSPSPSHSSQQRHFYLAVDRLQFKIETLVDLLGVVGRRSGLPVIVCCSSRDELDAVCSAVSGLAYISLVSLCSDLSEAERAAILENFRQVTSKWYQNVPIQLENDGNPAEDNHKSHMLVVTDACLPVSAPGESPLSACVLINYELPMKKVMPHLLTLRIINIWKMLHGLIVVAPHMLYIRNMFGYLNEEDKY